MAPIVSSIEIARSPGDVFDYVTDPSHLAEWQDSVIASHTEGDSPPVAGSRAVTTRRVGRGERTMAAEITKHDPPTSWDVRGTVKSLDDGRRSRVTIELGISFAACRRTTSGTSSLPSPRPSKSGLSA